MFTSFNVENIENLFNILDQNQQCYDWGKKQTEKQKKQVYKNINELVSGDIIDGDMLQKIWFPDEIFGDKPFIFMSHSHKDEELVLKLAGFINGIFGINCFIDSCIWGYCEDLKKELNDCTNGVCHKCECGNFTYNLNCIDMMLSSALMSVIDKSECLFFINTPSSINLRDKTESPWIYYELNIASIIEKKSHVTQYLNESCRSFIAKSIEFTPKIQKMKELDTSIILKWAKAYIDNRTKDAFALLYEIMGEYNEFNSI